MSGLAHFFEDEGIATSIVALVRPHAERMRPPRALWVPFELGRPLGTPRDQALQQRVMRSALGLFASETAAGRIVDFEGEQTDATDDPDWRNPLPADSANLLDEIEQLAPDYERAVQRNGRTSVGVSTLAIADAARYLLALDSDSPLPNPVKGLADASLMRYAADDLKAYYLEAASHGDTLPSVAQLGDWLWQHTRAGHLLRALRRASLKAADDNRRLIGTGSLVTKEWADRLD